MDTLHIAICQMVVGMNKGGNIQRAENMIRQAASRGASMVVLPEMFNCPYDTRYFPDFAEPYPDTTTRFLSSLARELGIFLVGGTIPELDPGGRIYNTCYTFDPQGRLIHHYRKIHLFDINIPGKIEFRESATLSPGHTMGTFLCHDIPMATMICYDVRFPELARLSVLEGAKVIIIPASFNTTTGPLHWEILMRCRAIDNQCYIIAASAARNPQSAYQAWGHSLVIDPWGTILAQAGEKESLIEADIDMQRLHNIRQELPLLQHRRKDLYQVCLKEGEK